MDRLTARCGDNRAVPTRVDLTFAFDIDDETYLGLVDIFDRLANYEETGLEPKDIDALMERSEGLAERFCEVTCNQAVSYDRLRELAEADKDGRCVVSAISPEVKEKSSSTRSILTCPFCGGECS
jgi:hypothetical protein